MFGFDHFLDGQPLIVDEADCACRCVDELRLWSLKVTGLDEHVADAVLADVRFDQTGAPVREEPERSVGGGFERLAGEAFRQQLIGVGQPARSENAKADFRVDVIADPEPFARGRFRAAAPLTVIAFSSVSTSCRNSSVAA